MNSGVIDRFTDVFTRYIDSGFGLLGGEVAFLASTLIVIDVTIAGLFWAWSAEEGSARPSHPEDSIVLDSPHDAERLRKNPLGVFVHAINWSKELG